jgi:arabinogalactan oligomer / maltooligosaccharide transport system substrate-binding protein
MQFRRLYKILCLLIAAILLVGCVQAANPNLTQAGVTEPPVSTLTLSEAFLQSANIQLSPTSGNLPLSVDDTQTAEAYPYPPTDTDTPVSYPGPTEELGTPTSYPGPTTEAETPTSFPGPTSGVETPTAYPGPETPTVTSPIRTPLPNVSSTPFFGLTPTQSFFELTQTAQAGTPGAGFTPAPTQSVTTTQKPISTSQPPQNLFQTVTIWHSWSPAETQTLEDVIRDFQSIYPNIKFVLMYVPLDELQAKYDRSAYLGNGPSILLGPADWGPAYYDKGLVADLSNIAPAEFLATLNPAALNEARYRGALIGLPYAIRSGVVMYRNKTILPVAPATFDDLIAQAKAATHAGTVGAYLEWSFFYSAAHLDGLGAQLMDQNGDPTFNTALGVEWLKLLTAFKQAGPIEFNGNRDLDTFKSGKAGIIIDGTWNKTQLAKAIGAQNLAIDPWPAYREGHLAGYLQTDNIYLSTNVDGEQRYAALQFMGFFLAREVQSIMIRAGHIPAVMDIQVDDPLMQQEMLALKGAVAYPIQPEVRAYWDPLQAAMLSVVNDNADPLSALQKAFLDVQFRIASIRATANPN